MHQTEYKRMTEPLEDDGANRLQTTKERLASLQKAQGLVAPKESPIRETLNCLREEVFDLRGVVNSLHNRLGAVSRPQPEEGEPQRAGTESRSSPMSPLRDSLIALISEIRAARENVEGALGRLEV